MKRDKEFEHYGYLFNYKNHKIQKSKPLNRAQMNIIGDDGSNSCGMFVKCDNCNSFMIFELDHYECPICKTKVREMTAFNQLERENNQFMNSFEIDDIPKGCQACGGPYPNCTISCNLFDD